MSTKPTSPMGTKPAAPAPAPTAAATSAAPAKKPTRTKTVDPNETDEQKFKRLAVPRTEKALNACRQLKNLARLKPTAEHREKVFGAIRAALNVAETAWKGETVVSEGFNL